MPPVVWLGKSVTIKDSRPWEIRPPLWDREIRAETVSLTVALRELRSLSLQLTTYHVKLRIHEPFVPSPPRRVAVWVFTDKNLEEDAHWNSQSNDHQCHDLWQRHRTLNNGTCHSYVVGASMPCVFTFTANVFLKTNIITIVQTYTGKTVMRIAICI